MRQDRAGGGEAASGAEDGPEAGIGGPAGEPQAPISPDEPINLDEPDDEALLPTSGPRAAEARAQIRAILAEPGHAVDNARRAVARLERAFDEGELQATPTIVAMVADLTVALEAEEGQRLGGKSAEAARFILRAISRELDRA